MNVIQQAKAKLKPPPPPPKPSHLTRFTQPTSTTTTTAFQPNTSHHLSKKRGLGWPWDYQPALFPLFTTVPHPPTWLFNWELWVPPSQPTPIEWVPCVRTAAQCTNITPFLTDISTNKGRPIHHFLGFNEPEIPSQANLSVGEAVRLWREFVVPAKETFRFRLGSPGVSSDVGRCVRWLDEFFGGLGGVQSAGVDFLVVHWYGRHFGEMRVFLEMMHEMYRLPVWVNEFACSTMGKGEASQGDVEAFIREAIPWLEACEWIERYAYFGNAQGQDVGTWVGRASNFTEPAEGCEETGSRRLSKVGKLYLEL